ncbi:MAG: amino acid ABC transporter permease [Actinobacteria bacterium]|nr:amino acid ABC transporter permease [Actinomycetota bacterium]
MTSAEPFFDFTSVWSSMPMLLKGFGIAMACATVAIILAIILGLIVALMRLSRIKFLRWFAFIYTQFFRGIPLYVLIIWVYFGLAIAAGVNLPAIPAGILTLALLNSGYLSETFRSGILAINKGQVEAGTALGLSRRNVMRHIILPQAFRVIIPPLGNQYVDAIKDTAILSIIGVPELMRESKALANLYYRPFEFYTFAGLLYLFAVLVVSRGISVVEKKLSAHSAQTPATIALSK